MGRETEAVVTLWKKAGTPSSPFTTPFFDMDNRHFVNLRPDDLQPTPAPFELGCSPQVPPG